jgi:hypothetical protein
MLSFGWFFVSLLATQVFWILGYRRGYSEGIDDYIHGVLVREYRSRENKDAT